MDNHKRLNLFILIVICVLAWGKIALSQPGSATRDVQVYTYKVINSYPHDPAAFTQGLFYYDGYLYEGTGQYGKSSLRKVRLEDGEVLEQVELSSEFFGEGITLFEDRIMQLTWKDHQGFVYQLDTLELIGQFKYSTEGWGITTDGTYLIMSDGTAQLAFLDPHTFEVVRRLDVHGPEGPLNRLNELEYINGVIYANVWLTDNIAGIDPQTGRVIAWIDLGSLLEQELRDEYTVDVLNGIAYDDESGRLFVTGKLWPRLYEVELIAVD